MASAVETAGGQATAKQATAGRKRGREFGRRLRALRDGLGWSQEKLALKCGIRKERISRMECGHTGDPRVSTVRRLAVALGCSVDELI